MSSAEIASTQKQNTVVICLSPYAGGMELDAIKMANLLCTRVEILLIAKKGCFLEDYYYKYLSNPGFKLAVIDFNHNFSFAIIREVRRLIKLYNIGNVIYLGASELRSLYFSFLGKNLNVIIRHGTTKSRPKKDILHRLVYSCVNYHVAICEHLARNVEYIIPFAKKTRLKVIYPSLRKVAAVAEEFKFGGNNPVALLHVGRIADGKGQKEAIAACGVLWEKNIAFELSCVGDIDPGYENEFRRFCDSVPYRDCIRIVGFSDNVNEYYRQSSIFLFPSKGEGLSNAFIEALASGLICIAFNNTSFPELKQLGFQILLAENRSIDDLRKKLGEAVQRLKRSPTPRLEQARLAMNTFSANRERNEYLDLLR